MNLRETNTHILSLLISFKGFNHITTLTPNHGAGGAGAGQPRARPGAGGQGAGAPCRIAQLPAAPPGPEAPLAGGGARGVRRRVGHLLEALCMHAHAWLPA